jgi:hypothetical protein
MLGKSCAIQEIQKGLTVASIGRLECGDVSRAQLVGSYQRAAAPFEPLPREFSEEQIRHKAGVSTVAVREHMNGDEAMMVAGSNLYRRVGLMPNLSSNVAEHLAQPHRNFEPGHAYILIRAARLSRPLPSLIEHAAVHGMNEALFQWIAAAPRE